MSISFGSARLLRYVVASAARFSEVAVIDVGERELALKSMDPSKTALLILTVPRESAVAYDAGRGGQLVVNLEDLGKVFRSAERDDAVTLSWTQSSLSIAFERRGYSRVFTLPLSTSVEEIPEIEIDYPNTYVVPPTLLYDGITGIESAGDVLRVEGDGDELRLSVESELGEAEVVLSKERGGIEESDVGEPGFRVSYSIEFVSNVKPLIRIAERAVMKVGSELPLYLELSSYGSSMKYYVAPRAE